MRLARAMENGERSPPSGVLMRAWGGDGGNQLARMRRIVPLDKGVTIHVPDEGAMKTIMLVIGDSQELLCCTARPEIVGGTPRTVRPPHPRDDTPDEVVPEDRADGDDLPVPSGHMTPREARWFLHFQHAFSRSPPDESRYAMLIGKLRFPTFTQDRQAGVRCLHDAVANSDNTTVRERARLALGKFGIEVPPPPEPPAPGPDTPAPDPEPPPGPETPAPDPEPPPGPDTPAPDPEPAPPPEPAPDPEPPPGPETPAPDPQPPPGPDTPAPDPAPPPEPAPGPEPPPEPEPVGPTNPRITMHDIMEYSLPAGSERIGAFFGAVQHGDLIENDERVIEWIRRLITADPVRTGELFRSDTVRSILDGAKHMMQEVSTVAKPIPEPPLPEPQPATEPETPKKRGGWPKGKPRGPRTPKTS